MEQYQARILLVEDDEYLAEALQEALEDQGYRVQWAEDGTAALRLLAAKSFDLVVSDVQMRPMDGYTLLKALSVQHDAPPVLMMTAWGTISEAVQALQNGAVDYVVKPFTVDVLLEKLRKFALPHLPTDTQGPVAQSPAMLATLEMAKKVASTDATVLLVGESGVGKEVLAVISTSKAAVRRGHLLLLIVRPFRKPFSKPLCLGMKKEHLRVRRKVVLESSSRLKAVRCCWMK
jgi:Response regulator containing CheY-like receiver, AAA-type ATPase, and DNA-binding domains